MTDFERRLRQVVASANLPEHDSADPHHHGKPTDQREPASYAPAEAVVVVNERQWPDCEFCTISRGSVPATVRASIGYGPDRNLCDRCADTFAFGIVRRQLIPGLGHLAKPSTHRNLGP